MIFFKRKLPYSQEEIAEQIGQIGMLMQIRKGNSSAEEVKRSDNAIEAAQEVLNFMLDEVREWQNKQ